MKKEIIKIDDFLLGGIVLLVLSDIYMCKMKNDIVELWYVDDTYVQRECNETNRLFDTLHSYHPNIK